MLIELYGGPACASKELPALDKKSFTTLVEGVVKLGALGTAPRCSEIFLSAHQRTVWCSCWPGQTLQDRAALCFFKIADSSWQRYRGKKMCSLKATTNTPKLFE